MKVALVHDFLAQMGGAEKVLEVLHGMFPDAPVYTSVYDAKAMPPHFRAWDIRASFLQSLPLKRRLHRLALLLYPMAFESFDLSAYDVVISSSSAFAKGVVTPPSTIHLCYTYTPMRYAWTTRAYLKNERASALARLLLAPAMHYLRLWDTLAASRVDSYLAISQAVAERIRKYYRRDCEIIHPPVETDRFAIAPDTADYYILVSRFVPYKRIELAIEAFTLLERPLKVVGDGRQRRQLQAKAGPNIEFLGHVPNADLPGLLARAKAFIMPGEEDFGIAPVEANACGRPVIAYARGGALDTQIDGVTGVLFEEQTVRGLCEAVLRADRMDFDPPAIRAHARGFDTRCFQLAMARAVSRACSGEPLAVLAGADLPR